MPTTFIPFDGWKPTPSYFGEGWNGATNVYPTFEGWQPMRAFVGGASVADGPMLGRHAHLWTTTINSAIGPPFYSPDEVTLYTGSRLKLYAFNSGGFTNLSKVGNYKTYGAGWRFNSVGNDVWATNWVDPLQVRANSTGLFADGVVSTFKPTPRFLVNVREHMVGGNLSNAGRFQDEIVWSDANDPTNFDPAATGSTSTSIAGAKRLVSIPGMVTGLVGGQYLLAFKKLGIYYGEYTAPPAVFNFDILSQKVGTAYPSSIINSRYGIFFLGLDGFYQISGLSEPQKISPAGIEQILLTSGFSAYPFSAIVAHDAGEEDMQAVGFEMPGLPFVGWVLNLNWATSGGTYLLLYNPVSQAWAQITLPTAATAVATMPHAASIYDQVIALLWNGTVTKYGPLSASGTVLAPTLQLNFRPTFDQQDPMKIKGQAIMKYVEPVFSKTSTGGAALTESVTVDALLDTNVAGIWKTETRLYSERDTITGAYPFQVAGRFFRISIQAAAEDFANFEGVFVTQEPL